jgi:hypothetical protein
MVRTLAYKFYWKIEQKIVPGLRSAQYHYQEAVSAAMPPGGRWLDLGCGHQVFAEWMLTQEREWFRDPVSSSASMSMFPESEPIALCTAQF